METLLQMNGLTVEQVLGYKFKQETNEEWFENNLEMIIDTYQELHPEVIVNNGDPNDYLDFEELFEWACDYYGKD